MHRHRAEPKARPYLTALVLTAVMTFAMVGAGTALASFTSTRTASTTTSSGTLGPPTSLHCTTVVSTSVDLAWTAPTGVTTPSLLRYTVKRRASGIGSYVVLNGTPQAGTTYHDVPGALGVYDYVVSSAYQSWTSANTLPDVVTLAAVTSLCSA